ncbi:MAG: carbohydrate kinase family protein [Bacillota bacterium]|jgi:sugar/nucleoside kinase (ribokinase family)
MAVCFCIGESCIDVHVPPYDRLPQPGEVIINNDLALTLGGSAAYTASCLGRLGAETWIKIKVGRDSSAGMLRYLLNQEQVNTLVDVDEGEKTQVALTFARDNGKGYISSKPLLAVPTREEITDKGTEVLHIAGYLLYPELWNESTFELLSWARKGGILASLDSQMCPEPEQAKALFHKDLLGNLDVLFMDEKEVCNYFHTDMVIDVVQELQQLGVPIISIKMGRKGSITVTKDEVIKVPAFRVKPVNTVGAGDTYNGAFIYGLLQKWDLPKVASFANLIAGVSTTVRAYKKILSVDEACQILDKTQEEI